MIKKSRLIFLGLVCIVVPQSVFANEGAKVYQSINDNVNAQLVIVPYKNSTYLLQFKGFEHEYDNKTFLYKKTFKEKGYGGGSWYRMAGTDAISFTSLGQTILVNGSSKSYSEVYLSGKNPIKMLFVKNADLVIIRQVKAQYLRTQGILESRIAAKKHIEKAVELFNKNCHSSLKVKINWKEFSSAKQKTTPGMAHAYLKSLTRVCMIDKDYRAAIKKIRTLEIRLSTTPGKDLFSKADGKMTIYTNKLVPNVLKTSYGKIKDLL